MVGRWFVESHKFRKRFITLSYVLIVLLSMLGTGKYSAPNPYSTVLRVVGTVAFVSSVLAAVKIHSMFPKERHDRPEDFSTLLKEGPYAYCRHPFYLALIINQASIPLLFSSWLGLLTYAALLPGWWVLIRLEEKELVKYWGDEYVNYMRDVPALIPLPRRRRRDKSC